MTTPRLEKRTIWTLPPLILHPFSNATDPVRLLAGPRANAAVPGDPTRASQSAAQIQRKLLLAKYCEVRMLWCIGKDLLRWIDQCLDFVSRRQELLQKEIKFQSFSTLLIENTPGLAAEKLRRWGVMDFKGIFARAVGLGTLFSELPAFGILTEDFLRDYYIYAYQLYVSRQERCSFARLDPSVFTFEVYTSGEYIKIIERHMSEI